MSGKTISAWIPEKHHKVLKDSGVNISDLIRDAVAEAVKREMMNGGDAKRSYAMRMFKLLISSWKRFEVGRVENCMGYRFEYLEDNVLRATKGEEMKEWTFNGSDFV